MQQINYEMKPALDTGLVLPDKNGKPWQLLGEELLCHDDIDNLVFTSLYDLIGTNYQADYLYELVTKYKLVGNLSLAQYFCENEKVGIELIPGSVRVDAGDGIYFPQTRLLGPYGYSSIPRLRLMGVNSEIDFEMLGDHLLSSGSVVMYLKEK